MVYWHLPWLCLAAGWQQRGGPRVRAAVGFTEFTLESGAWRLGLELAHILPGSICSADHMVFNIGLGIQLQSEQIWAWNLSSHKFSRLLALPYLHRGCQYRSVLVWQSAQLWPLVIQTSFPIHTSVQSCWSVPQAGLPCLQPAGERRVSCGRVVPIKQL